MFNKVVGFSLFILFAACFSYADSTSANVKGIVEEYMVIVKEPKIISFEPSILWTCDYMQFTAETVKSGKRYVCAIATNGDNLSKHWEEIFGRLIKNDKVFIKGKLYSHKRFLLVEKIITKEKNFTSDFYYVKKNK